MLTVIEDEQKAPVANEVDQCGRRAAPRSLTQGERGGGLLRHVMRVGAWRQLDPGDGHRLLLGKTQSDRSGEARFSASSCAGEREHSVAGEELLQLR
jgi:hypothetical protein